MCHDSNHIIKHDVYIRNSTSSILKYSGILMGFSEVLKRPFILCLRMQHSHQNYYQSLEAYIKVHRE